MNEMTMIVDFKFVGPQLTCSTIIANPEH